MAYKKDQGRMVRMAAFWSLALLLFYGCMSLHTTLVVNWSSLGKSLISGVDTIPIIGITPSGAFLIAALVLAGGLFLLNSWQQKEKNAELLIETENELKKVTWPTMDEAMDGSLVVIICVVFLMAFMAGADWVLGRLVGRVLLG